MTCFNNQLTALNVSGCSRLAWLLCANNRLTALNVDGLSKLRRLDCAMNQIQSIDLTKCNVLKGYAKKKPVTLSDGTVGFGTIGRSDPALRIDASTCLVIGGKAVYGTVATSLAGARIEVADQAYKGKALKPTVKVTLNGKALAKGKDYTVAYANNTNVGTATVTVTGVDAYKDTASATFRINPKAVSGLKPAAGKRALTASWKQVAGVGGYQIEYAASSDFSGAKQATVSRATTLKRTLKKLTSGKIYYVRVRAWQKVGGKLYYSAWTKAKKAKVK